MARRQVLGMEANNGELTAISKKWTENLLRELHLEMEPTPNIIRWQVLCSRGIIQMVKTFLVAAAVSATLK
jgi:hypothetical protein